MPPRGGAPLSDSDVKAVAAFLWGNFASEIAGTRGVDLTLTCNRRLFFPLL